MKALALACAVLVLASCAGTDAGTARSATPSATATPRDYGAPPPRVSLLYAHDPWNAGRLVGYDWSGNPRATLKVGASDPGFLSASPAGSGFLRQDGVYLDRLGQPIAGPSAPAQKSARAGMWSEGGLLCFVELDERNFTWTLETQRPGEAVHRVAVIARDQGVGQTGIAPVACSERNDVAILVRTTVWWPSEAWAVRLSSGKVLNHRTYSPRALATIVASPSGAYVAENSANSQGVSREGAVSTLVRRLPDWSVVGALDSGYEVLAFSGDDSTALVTRRSLAQQGVSLAGFELPSGRVKWWYDGIESVYRWAAHPTGPMFAVALRGPKLLNRIVIFGPAGPLAAIPGALEPLF